MLRQWLLALWVSLVSCKEPASQKQVGSATTGSSTASSTGSSTTGSAAGSARSATPSTGGMQGGITETADELHARYIGNGADFATIPSASAALGGLPLLGAASFHIDVRVPKVKGVPDYEKATGAIDVRTGRFQIGDDKTRLGANPPGPRGSGAKDSFAGDGIAFGHLTVDAFEARIELANGRAELVKWKLDSSDVTIELRASAALDSTLGRSTLDGCLRFAAKSALRQRDPQMDALIQTTGAMREADGMFHITLAGDLDRPKRLAKACKP